ncbi:hypothetical protein ACIRL2_43915 [Embleya sp. NPDC127516]|uniref:hypothetical protein n=1 Tax=Embleya sp. NPDC127516 TaxID=3363990 RepID=UPI0037F23523
MRGGRIFEWDPELIGFHDPRHGVAVAVGWEDYRGQDASIIEAHRKVAPAFLARGFTEGVEAWGRYEEADLAARRLPRALQQLTRSESVRQLEDAMPLWAPYLATIVTNAAPHVGITKEVGPELMAGVLMETLRPLVVARAGARASAVGVAPASAIRDRTATARDRAADSSPLSMDALAAPILGQAHPARGSGPQVGLRPAKGKSL